MLKFIPIACFNLTDLSHHLFEMIIEIVMETKSKQLLGSFWKENFLISDETLLLWQEEM